MGITKKTGLIKPQIIWTEERINFLKENYPLYGSGIIMREYDISRGAVKAMTIRLGIKCLKSKNLEKLKILYDETSLNYYWLGFIMADGHINNEGELKIVLSIKDIDHLNKFAQYLSINLKLDKTNNYCIINVKDVKYGIAIKNKLNITTSKTYTPPSLEFLNTKDKLLSFFAGFIDGDGCIWYNNKNRATCLKIMCHGSWVDNLQYFKMELLKYYNMNISVSITKKGYSLFSLCTAFDILTLKDEFEKLKLPIMDRKWLKLTKESIGNHHNTKTE